MGKSPLNPFNAKSPLNPIGTKGKFSAFRIVEDVKKLGGGNGGDPAAPPVVPGAVPPVAANAADVVQAGIDLRRANAFRKGLRSTVRAGDNGGFKLPGGDPTKLPPAG